MDTLPALGSTYNSMAHFKVDVYAKAVISAEILRTIGPDNKDLSRLVCPFTTRTGQECDLGIASISIAGSIVVVHRKIDHTCDGKASDKAIRDANNSMLQKFDQVLDNVTKSNGEETEGGPKKRASNRLRRARKIVEEGKGMKKGEKEEEKRESRSMEEYEELLARYGDDHTKDKRKKQLEAKDVAFPRAVALQDTIDQLRTAIVQLPSPDDTFSTQEELLARLYAFAQQRDVLLRPVFSLASASRKSLACGCNDFNHDSVGKGRCPLAYTILQSKDEAKTWSLVHPVADHTHAISEPLVHSSPEEDALMLPIAAPVASTSAVRSPFFTRPTDDFALAPAPSNPTNSKRQLELDYLTPSPPSSKTRRLSSIEQDPAAVRSGSH